jgi:hypothetical protein
MPSDGDRVITMSSGEVESLRRDLTNLSERVQGLDGKLDLIHTAVSNLAKRTYIPGPSIWKRLGCFLGLIRL